MKGHCFPAIAGVLLIATTACGTNQSTGTVAQQPVAQNAASPSIAQTTASPSPVSRQVESCITKMAMVNDPNPPLNVRSSPSVETGQVVGQLKNGTFVTVEQEDKGWFRITTPTKGWIAKQRTDSGCNQKVERLTMTAENTAVTINDRFIGAGSHKYLLQANQGQTLTLIKRQGPFPVLMAPDGKVLVGAPGDDQQKQWSGQLPQSGDYTILFDSNYRGYKYSFQVDMQ